MAHRRADDRTTAAFAAAGVLLLASAAVLAGCVPSRGPAPAGGAAGLEPKAGFFFNADSGRVKFGYGVPDSDLIDMMMSCAPGSGRIEIIYEVESRALKGKPLVIGAGSARAELAATLDDNEESDGKLAIAATSIDTPVLAAFRKTGTVTLNYAGAKQSFSASVGEQAMAARFFAVCERK